MPVAVSVAVFVTEIGEAELDGVMLPDAPGESGGVGVALIVVDADTVLDPLSLPLGVPLRVGVPVPVTDVVCDAVGV